MPVTRPSTNRFGLLFPAVCAWLLQCAAAHGQVRTAVAVELVLALDSSASVNADEFKLQLGGIAQAFTDPDVLAAIDRLKPLGVAVAIVQWGGPGKTQLAVPFTHVATAREARAFGHLTRLVQRRLEASSTAIGSAINDSRRLLEANGFAGGKLVIDISGDGRNNNGPSVEYARKTAAETGITVNGLAIESEEPKLTEYYEQRVIAGSGAFVETARGYEDFARAIRAKLLRELVPPES